MDMALTPAQAGELFYELVWPVRADLLRLARFLTGNEADAEDLAQDTLLKAFGAIESFRRGTDVRAWLVRILRNTRIDRARVSARELANVSLDAAEIDLPDPSLPPETEAWQQQDQDPEQILNAFSDQQMIDALQELPEEIRMTLLLVDVQQMDHKQAAEILEVPVGTIKSRTHRGRAMLRNVLLPLARELRMVK